MDSSQMQWLVDSHMTAENHGDIDGAVAVYTEDVEHDVFEFRDGLISRENIWLDTAAVADQLS